ncbi:MAG: hypothetical protein AAF664_06900, partial [Planctomycetota bacterium]
FRHDLTDPQIVVGFAKEVATIRRLELLVVHSYCDLKAVGPDVATDWKLNLTEDLYRRTRNFFDSGRTPGSPGDDGIDNRRQELVAGIESFGSEEQPASVCVFAGDGLVEKNARASEGSSGGSLSNLPDSVRQFAMEVVERLPASLVSRCHVPTMVQEILGYALLATDHKRGPACIARFDPMLSAVRYTILRREDGQSMSTFAKATGALAASGLSILRAQIETVDNYAWDSFWAIDVLPGGHDSGQIESGRLDRVCRKLAALVEADTNEIPRPKSVWQPKVAGESNEVEVLPTQVTFDNETIADGTIVSLFAYDRVGLLARIATAFRELELVLSFAKIDTHLDQVADVFYVTEQDGGKLVQPERINEVRERLVACA